MACPKTSYLSYTNCTFPRHRYPKEMSALDETDHEEVDGQLTIPIPERHKTGTIAVNGTGSDGAKRKVETKDASNGVRMFCKHCGHPVDLDD